MIDKVMNMALCENQYCESQKKYYIASALNSRGFNSTKAIFTSQGQISNQTLIYIGWHNHNEELIVDMPLCKDHRRSNAEGWLRDRGYYFSKIQERNPQAISETNAIRIKYKMNIVIDKQFIEAYPEYSSFLGDTLVHHHIGGGRQAVAVPSKLHINNIGIHDDEKKLGITESAKKYSDFCKQKIIKNPKVTDESLHTEYLNSLKIQNQQPFANKEEITTEVNSIAKMKELMEVLSIPIVYSEIEKTIENKSIDKEITETSSDKVELLQNEDEKQEDGLDELGFVHQSENSAYVFDSKSSMQDITDDEVNENPSFRSGFDCSVEEFCLYKPKSEMQDWESEENNLTSITEDLEDIGQTNEDGSESVDECSVEEFCSYKSELEVKNQPGITDGLKENEEINGDGSDSEDECSVEEFCSYNSNPKEAMSSAEVMQSTSEVSTSSGQSESSGSGGNSNSSGGIEPSEGSGMQNS